MLIPHSPASRKAGYGCTQRYAPEGTMHRIAGSSSASYMDPLTTMGVRPRTRTGLHGNRVGVSMPLEIALSPQARKARFLPASTQDWASQADTRSFTGVPFGGFLGPPSETADLTRILRRRLAHISIAWLAKICNSFRIYTERLTISGGILTAFRVSVRSCFLLRTFAVCVPADFCKENNRKGHPSRCLLPYFVRSVRLSAKAVKKPSRSKSDTAETACSVSSWTSLPQSSRPSRST